MSLKTEQRNELFKFLQLNIRSHPSDIVKITQEKFSLTRPAILNYLKKLEAENKILIEGTTRDRKYSLLPLVNFSKTYKISDHLAEDKVWREDISVLLKAVKKNVFDICQYGFSEIFNNALDHSEGNMIVVELLIFFDQLQLSIADDGIGIFNKIQQKYHLDDPSHAILELSKGKLTTDPKSHSGEGIFFTSKMFDLFSIHSYKLIFGSREDISILWDEEENTNGTVVSMQISPNSERTTKSIFDKFTNDEMSFEKTVVPVKLVRYGEENLISRSQAKRLLARLEKFKIVMLDFEDVQNIGRAFADEIFRVFKNAHPNMTISPINASKEIIKLIHEIQLTEPD